MRWGWCDNLGWEVEEECEFGEKFWREAEDFWREKKLLFIMENWEKNRDIKGDFIKV